MNKRVLLWLFFGLKGRLSPAPFFLAGLLIFVTEAWLISRFVVFPPDAPELDVWGAVFALFLPLSVWCNCALTAKRFHDFGRPGILSVITLIVNFPIFVVLVFIKGDPGPNDYGERPDEPA